MLSKGTKSKVLLSKLQSVGASGFEAAPESVLCVQTADESRGLCSTNTTPDDLVSDTQQHKIKNSLFFSQQLSAGHRLFLPSCHLSPVQKNVFIYMLKKICFITKLPRVVRLSGTLTLSSHEY